MALDDLLAAMRSEADEEIARLERDSRREETEILERAAEHARALEGELLRAADAELEAELRRRQSHARLDALVALREARERAFADLLEGARARLAALRGGDRHGGVLAALLSESRAALPGARILHVDPRDEGLARELVGDGQLELRPDLDTVGGLELETHDGRLLRNTLEARLVAAEPRLRLRFGSVLAEIGAHASGEKAPRAKTGG